jgi:hypothetical protein
LDLGLFYAQMLLSWKLPSIASAYITDEHISWRIYDKQLQELTY